MIYKIKHELVRNLRFKWNKCGAKNEPNTQNLTKCRLLRFGVTERLDIGYRTIRYWLQND